MKVVLYARVSSDKQDTDLSLSAQLKALRDYAERNNYLVVKEFVDEAESGRTAARPAFREMISMAKRPGKPIDAVLVWKYSRFARSREDSIVYKTLLRKNGIQVISINEPFEDTATGRLLEAMIESLDEFYSANLGEEITRGLRESASRGFFLTSKAPYGYRRVKVKDGDKERPKLEIEPSQTPIVKSMFNDVIGGKGLKEIVKDLNNRGIPGPSGKSWTKTTLHKILTNEVYTGTLVWGRESKRNLAPIRVEHAWPVIIDKDIFEAVRKKLHDRSPSRLNPRIASSRYLLSGLVKCGHCGKALVGQEAKGGRFSYYVCDTLLKKGSGSCEARYYNSNKLDEVVIQTLKDHILNKESLKGLVDRVNNSMGNETSSYHDELAIVLNEIITISGRLDKLYDALETGKVDLDDLAPRIKGLRLQLEQLQNRKYELECHLSDRKVELADLKSVMGYVDNLRSVLDRGTLQERKAFIRSFVRSIKVTGDDAKLSYMMPVPPEWLAEEKVRVLYSVRYGGAGGIRTPYLLTASQTFSQLNYSPTRTNTI